MNDDFLHRIRIDPPARFLATLKAKLDAQEAARSDSRRFSLRTLLLGALIGSGGVALALVASGNFLQWFNTLNPARYFGAAAPVQQSSPNAAGSKPGAAMNAGSAPAHFRPEPRAAPGPAATPASQVTLSIVGPASLNANTKNGASRQPDYVVTNSTKALALFCGAAGDGKPDRGSAPGIVAVNRRMLRAELDECLRNGVAHIVEFNAGYEAIVLVRSTLYTRENLSTRDIFLALAAQVPDFTRSETLIKNPNTYWNQVNPELDVEHIDVSGPSLSSATGTAFIEMLVEAGCRTFPWLAALKDADERRYDAVCKSVRTDGAYRELAGENLLGHLETNPNALGIVSYRDYQTISGTLVVSAVDGIEPAMQTIAAGTYPGSRELFVYMNKTRAFADPRIQPVVASYLRSLEAMSDATAILPPDAAQRGRNSSNLYMLQDLRL
jgi:phosphate transport system substrate-binding protein